MNAKLTYNDTADTDELALIRLFLKWKHVDVTEEYSALSSTPTVDLDGLICHGFQSLLAAFKPRKRRPESGSGEERKLKATGGVESKYKGWVEMAIVEIMKLAANGETFTADDLRWLQPPAPQCKGTAFLVAAKRGLITHVGYQPSTTPESHAVHLKIWKLAEVGEN